MISYRVILLLSSFLLLAESQGPHEGFSNAVTFATSSLLAIGIIGLVLGIGASIAGFIIFRLFLRWKKKDTLQDENTEQEGSTVLGIHTYDQIDSQNRPNDVSAAPMPYETAVSDIYNDVAPPIPPHPPIPEEMGFTVTKEIDDHQDGYEEFEPDPTRAAKNALVTPNPFYTTTDNSTNPQYENHELVEYEDYEDLSGGKRDLSVEDPSRQNFQLQSAINFCDRQDIEGELIDEVDYQNVTVVRTKVLNSRQDYPSHQDLLQQGMATTAIQWQEKSTDSADFNRSYNQKDQLPVPNTSSVEDFAEEVYDDVSQMAQDKLYQNFGAEHSSVARVQSSTSLKEDEDIYEDTRMDSDVAATEIYDGMDDLYMNTGSIQNKTGSNEADIDYENMVLGKFRT